MDNLSTVESPFSRLKSSETQDMAFSNLESNKLGNRNDIFEYRDSEPREGLFRDQIRGRLLNTLGSDISLGKGNFSDHWVRISQLNERQKPNKSHLKRLLRLINPFRKFFPEAVLEDIVRQMNVYLPRQRSDETIYQQILAFIESYERSQGKSLTLSLLKEIQEILEISIDQQSIFNEYYRLKKNNAPLYPSSPMPEIIKGLIGYILSILDVPVEMKKSLHCEIDLHLPKKPIKFPELYAWAIIRQLLRSRGLQELPKHPDKETHSKILQLEYRMRNELGLTRNNQEKKNPSYTEKIEAKIHQSQSLLKKELSTKPVTNVFPEEFQKILTNKKSLPPELLREIAMNYLSIRRMYRGKSPMLPLVAALIRLNCYKYFGRSINKLCQEWNVPRTYIYTFLKRIRGDCEQYYIQSEKETVSNELNLFIINQSTQFLHSMV